MLYQISVCMMLGYFIGCINPSYLLGRVKGVDVRREGSGNAGATNAFLLIGKAAFFIVAIFDITKAWFAWKLAAALFPKLRLAGVLGGCACTMGHMFPAFLHFKGGKGFACMGGMILAYDPVSFPVFLLAAIIIGIITQYLFVVTGSISLLFPMYYGFTSRYAAGTVVLLLLALPILWKHRENYLRMKAGKELRLSYLVRRDREIERCGYEEEDRAIHGERYQ